MFKSSLLASLVFAAISLPVATHAHAELTHDDAFFIVEKVTQDHYQFSVWSGMHSFETADFNGDQRDDFIALVKPSADKKAENPPTHLLVILGDAEKTPFEKAKTYSLVELDQGVPGDFPEGYVAVEKKERAEVFAKIGCHSERAIEMIEEASTAFYFCWNGGKFEFMRDPEDTP